MKRLIGALAAVVAQFGVSPANAATIVQDLQAHTSTQVEQFDVAQGQLNSVILSLMGWGSWSLNVQNLSDSVQIVAGSTSVTAYIGFSGIYSGQVNITGSFNESIGAHSSIFKSFGDIIDTDIVMESDPFTGNGKINFYSLTVGPFDGPIFRGSDISGGVLFGSAGVSGQLIYNYTVRDLSAVPEPASWALMILGMGGVGAFVRKRRGGMRLAIISK